MNKQQLAANLWESANKMRSKIEANEYKDYILGFMFYKFLSDKEVRFLKKNDYTDEDIEELTEEDVDSVEFIKNGVGYFISYKDLFSTWIEKGKDFDVSDVRDALSAFSRLINPSHEKVFKRIFYTLQTGLSKLGDSSGSQTKAIGQLIQLIKVIPMDGKQDYDVLGFIYEYLISQFAANAGKKAGEFYTPHEVSLLMAEIVANHLKEKNEIKIYDPTSGSGSLLINIGQAVAKHIDDENNIKYYAQEWKENTYNLTRMNLVMRGILPDNIVTRNGDTLEEDWPYFDENHEYEPLYVNAVVSNPPYSQNWDSENKESDPRYAEYGLAPKTKADYAFLLHDLYHLVPDGIMTIVLPHGVLFRGGEEEEIRKQLIEKDKIDTIIGLPSNIFFGTGIPTIIMVLRQNRTNNDVLIVDASKGFVKEGKNNKLQASDIKKIVDTVINRESIDKYSRVVTKEEIRENDYNLNIPRYVDSSDPEESWDIYASMFGGIPKSEIEELKEYWEAFPSLKKNLFEENGTPYVSVSADNLKEAIITNNDVKQFNAKYSDSFSDFQTYLKRQLIENVNSLSINREESIISQNIFSRLAPIPLINKYEAYQALDDEWTQIIAIDLEILQTEGIAASKKVDPNLVIKKKRGKETEVQEGWVGRIFPFDLVQETYLNEEKIKVVEKENRLAEITAEYEEIIDSMSEEEKASSVLNDANDAFVSSEVNKAVKRIMNNIESEEINQLNQYSELITAKAPKYEKLNFIESHNEIDWSKMEPNKDGTFGKAKVNAYIKELQKEVSFPEETFEAKIMAASNLITEEKEIKKAFKQAEAELHEATKTTIENLTDSQIFELLELKWIQPIVVALKNLPENCINHLVSKIAVLVEKYAVTYSEVATEITEVEASLATMIEELDGNEFDKKSLSEFQSFLRGE